MPQPHRRPLATATATALALALLPGHAGAAPATSDGADELGHRATVWESKAFAAHRTAAMDFADDYRAFLTKHKTEREVVAAAIDRARAKGFRDLLADKRPAVKAGAKLYAVAHGKIAALIVVGTEPLDEGVRVVATHVDAVRIDLKQRPIYADGNLAFFETHYYGGIKKYQWLSEPLELRGVVAKKDGTLVEIAIGDDPDEPVLVIPDEAVHVSWSVDGVEGEQVPGEHLDPIVASIPSSKSKAGADPYAAAVAELLQAELGIAVDDLASAELELVPAGAARNVGLDRSMIGGYGQDDRACTYAALRAVLETGAPAHTAIVMLVDKEEIGSTGNTGAASAFFRRVVGELVEGAGGSATEVAIDRVLGESIVVSADVTGAANPLYADNYDSTNSTFLGSGIAWSQNGVHAELMSHVRDLLDDAGVAYQATKWGKSRDSKSETNTVLPFFTEHGMNGLTLAIPVLSMHAPFEVLSKADLYEGFRAYRAFLAD
jgi:aspartyl aminopeptidase